MVDGREFVSQAEVNRVAQAAANDVEVDAVVIDAVQLNRLHEGGGRFDLFRVEDGSLWAVRSGKLVVGTVGQPARPERSGGPVPAASRPGPVRLFDTKNLVNFPAIYSHYPLDTGIRSGMPGQRATASPHARESWRPRLAGIGVVVLLAAGGVTAYLLAMHPGSAHPAATLPTKVITSTTVGLITVTAQPGRSSQLLELLGPQGTPQFSPLNAAQAAQGSPQWTADEMAGGTYIFILLGSGECLTGGNARQPALTLQHCDLGIHQRWRREGSPVVSQGHDFYQYSNLGDGACLAQGNVLPGPVYDASLAQCAQSAPAGQLIAFWGSGV